MAFSYAITPDTGSNSTDHLTSGNASHDLVLSGTGTRGDLITISYLDPVTHQTVTLHTTIANNGTWTIPTTSLSDGGYAFTIAESGTSSKSINTSVISPTWIIDTHVTAETFSNVFLAGNNVVDPQEANQSTVPITGTLSTALAADEQLIITVGGQNYVAVVNGTSFSANVATPTASGSVSLHVVDTAGNTTTPVTQAFTVNTQSAAFSYAITPDTGSSSVDHVTSGNANHALVLSGTGTAGDFISISYINPTTHKTVTLKTTVASNGTWTTTTTTLADGSYTFTIGENGASKSECYIADVDHRHACDVGDVHECAACGRQFCQCSGIRREHGPGDGHVVDGVGL